MASHTDELQKLWDKGMAAAVRNAAALGNKKAASEETGKAERLAAIEARVREIMEQSNRWNSMSPEEQADINDELDKLNAEAAKLEGRAQYSIRDIYGDSGKHYGIGVYLNSELLTNLTDEERIEMVKEYVKELGGQVFTAYDVNGNSVSVRIAKESERFRNSKGKTVPANKDLATKFRKNKTKQESIVLIDELIATANFRKASPAKYPHGWLDDEGNNPWESWHTFLQDKENTVWDATLHVATSKNGDKYLYDIDPIKMVKQPGNSGTSTTKAIIRDTSEKSNTNFAKKSERDSEGNELSVGQQDFFRESKVRDSQGRLLEVYHATYGDFTVFDSNRKGENTDFNASSYELAQTAHIGFWFSNKNLYREAGLGNKAIPAYLSIDNPNVFDSIDQLIEDMGGQSGDEYAQRLKKDGYDGVIVNDEEFGGTSFVALNSNQAKLTSNLNPTGNADIRYSERDYVPEDRELLLNAAAEKGASAELTAYAKKVNAMEAAQRKADRLKAAYDAETDAETKTAIGKKLNEATGINLYKHCHISCGEDLLDS